nr:hypothetical protein [Candidatus Njordarchaeum guaymaensis]
MAKSESEKKGKKRSSLKEGIEPSAIFLSDFGAVLLLALLGLIGLLILTYAFALVVTVGLFIAAYSIAFGFSYLVSFGEVERAGEYARSAEKLKMKDADGTKLARGLVRTRLYFTFILFVLGAEEAIRFLVNTGPATFEVWIFRLACLAIYVIATVIFASRFAKWRQFKRTSRYKENLATIKRLEADRESTEGRA